jgi:heterodisulfide reductase subunit C
MSTDNKGNTIILGSEFAKEVQKRSGVDFNLCYHCQSCSGGCPFSQDMDFLPNQVIRLVQLGIKREALGCSTIWFCVGCNTCSIQCPNGIDMSSVTHTLCQMALKDESIVAEPDILKLHQEVLNTIQRYGRTHKLEVMLRYKLHKRDWFSDMGVGVKMLVKRKIEVLPSRVKQITEIEDFFKQQQGG